MSSGSVSSRPVRSSSLPSPRPAGRRCSARSPLRCPISGASCPTPQSSRASTGFRPWSARETRRAGSIPAIACAWTATPAPSRSSAEAMSDARYDAVVAGGGHHATIIAPYLARAGLSVLVLERSAHLGGGACSSEGPAPGFTMNHCSHWTRFYGHPAYRDFALHDEGLRYLFPEENEGVIFDDGSSFIGFSASRVIDAQTGRQERSAHNVQRTWEQISRFSRRDADAYLELLEAYERHWKPAFRRHRFTVPPDWGTPDPLEELLEIPGSLIEPVHQFMTLRQL